MDTTNANVAVDNAVAQAAQQVSKQAASASVEAAKVAGEAKVDAIKQQAASAMEQAKSTAKAKTSEAKSSIADKFSSLKDKVKDAAAKHNIDLDAIKEKAKELTAEGLEGASGIASKLSGAAHNASQKLSHQ